MRFLLFVCLVVGCLGSTAARAQVSAPQPSSAPTLDPAFAAMLLVSQENAQLGADPLPPEPSLSQSDRRSVRRGRWLLAAGVSIVVGSVLGGVLAGRDHYCKDDDVQLDKTAPRVTSALLGSVGLTLTVVGATRLTSVPAERRELVRSGGGLTLGRAMASLGLSLASMTIVGLSAIPQAMRCVHLSS